MWGDRLLWKIFSFLSIALFALVFARLFQLQVVQYGFYDRLVDSQSAVRVSFTKDRGHIYDVDGMPLAQNHKKASLYTFGRNIDNNKEFIAALRKNGINVSSRTADNLAKNNSFVWISRQIDIKRAEAVKKAVPGVEYTLEDARFYPEGEMLSGILGSTGVDNQGLSGIEYFAEKTLAGMPIAVNVRKDSRGKLILFDDSALKTRPDSAVYLTVDAKLQAVADRILQLDMEEFKANKAIALAMDVHTGDIVLASSFSKDKADKGKNLATTYLFEPGSIFKTVSFGYLVEKGLYQQDWVVDVSKPVTLYGHSIKDVHPVSKLTQLEVFVKSSNIGTVTLTKNIGSEAFYKYLLRCGFGHKSGMDGVSEEAGMLREPKSWSGLSLASLSIGQEILTSPVQVVRFYAAVANKGMAPKPNIIRAYVENGEERIVRAESERFLSETSAATLMNMMQHTVAEGTGRSARTEITTIGGKTGTGQKIDKKTGTYSKTDYVASFAGVFPVEDPKLAMVVIYESPRSSIYGGSTGAVTFRKLAEQVAFYYNFGSDKTKVHYANR